MMPYNLGDILLDKYRIEKTLGQGAFGEAYLVTHLQLNVPRVVKVVRRDAPGIGSRDYAEVQTRFLLESRLGARLNSPIANPHLLQVFDCHISDELCLLEMEYASGGSLAERLGQARDASQGMPVGQVLRIGQEIAEGLRVLHTLGIVHRDVKPANILLDQQGRARLADLGLAQAPGGASQRSQLSQPRPHPGTPGYMSPEQENSGAYLTPASDIYSLGATLFEMLTGRFYRSLRPGTRASGLLSDLPAVVDDLLAKMLARDPEQRPWDGAEAAGALKAVQAELAGDAQRKAQAEAQARQEVWQKAMAEGRAREQAQEQARKEQETRAREQARQEQEARTQAEQKKQLETLPKKRPLPRKVDKGFLARYWGWLGLAVLLLGLCLVILPLVLSATTQSTSGVAWTQANVATPPTEVVQPIPSAGSYTRPADGMTMVYVPGGTFTMGSTDFSDFTPHQVTLSAYWIDQTDVTNAEYARCVAADGCTEPLSKSSATHADYYVNSQYAAYPVINVNWNQAKSYCEWTGTKLPTEAQWELSARGLDGRFWVWAGDTIDESYANSNRNIGDATAVCSYSKGNSQYGACDMAGNVKQWVADWYEDYSISPVSNPSGPASGKYRVLRGGSWNSDSGRLYTAYRYNDVPSDSGDDIGFRCARSQ